MAIDTRGSAVSRDSGPIFGGRTTISELHGMARVQRMVQGADYDLIAAIQPHLLGNPTKDTPGKIQGAIAGFMKSHPDYDLSAAFTNPQGGRGGTEVSRALEYIYNWQKPKSSFMGFLEGLKVTASTIGSIALGALGGPLGQASVALQQGANIAKSAGSALGSSVLTGLSVASGVGSGFNIGMPGPPTLPPGVDPILGAGGGVGSGATGLSFGVPELASGASLIPTSALAAQTTGLGKVPSKFDKFESFVKDNPVSKAWNSNLSKGIRGTFDAIKASYGDYQTSQAMKVSQGNYSGDQAQATEQAAVTRQQWEQRHQQQVQAQRNIQIRSTLTNPIYGATASRQFMHSSGGVQKGLGALMGMFSPAAIRQNMIRPKAFVSEAPSLLSYNTKPRASAFGGMNV